MFVLAFVHDPGNLVFLCVLFTPELCSAFFGFFAVHVGAVGGAAPAQGYTAEREVTGFGAGAAVAPATLHAFGARFFGQDARASTSGARVWRSTASSFAAILSRSPALRASSKMLRA